MVEIKNTHNAETSSVFKLQTLNEVINSTKGKTAPDPIFGDFGFQNEIILLGGSTNVGKSILAMDIAISNATGINHFGKPMSTGKKKVLYIDTELNDYQFTSRYQGCKTGKNLIRASFWEMMYGRTSTETFIEELEKLLYKKSRPELVILDNLCTICESMNSPKAVTHFLHEMKRIKETYQITLIIVSHFKKVTIGSPLTDDLFRGTGMLTAMSDTIIAVGNSALGADTKYLKLLKTRMVRKPDTVSVLDISDEKYLHFEYVEDADEMDILPQKNKRGPKSSLSDLEEELIWRLYEQGLSLRGIEQQTGISKSSVQRHLKSHIQTS